MMNSITLFPNYIFPLVLSNIMLWLHIFIRLGGRRKNDEERLGVFLNTLCLCVLGYGQPSPSNHNQNGTRGRRGIMNKYTAHKINGKRIDEHRLVMQVHLGRELKPIEVVHHIDGKKDNNDIDNLELFSSKKEHNLYHLKKGDLKLKCGSNRKRLIDGKLKCYRCKILKGLVEFENRKVAHLGVAGVCKTCRNKRKRERRACRVPIIIA